ncbi:hypothetical protein [Pseudomonas sp. PB3P13]
MISIEDFRINSHEWLIEMDAATMGMMVLVSSRGVSGPAWEEATLRHHNACEDWNEFLNARDPASTPGPKEKPALKIV